MSSSPVSMSSPLVPNVEKMPSRKDIQRGIRAEKLRLKNERKAALRRKTEKKLAEKAERKVFHKKANAQKKFQAKIKAKTK